MTCTPAIDRHNFLSSAFIEITRSIRSNRHIALHRPINYFGARLLKPRSILFNVMISLLFICGCRTKWKRQTSVGLELFVEAGNYAAYQRACASRFGQLDALPYGNPLMMSGAHGMLPPASSAVPNSAASAAEMYYQHALQNSMNGMPGYNLYGGAAAAAAAAAASLARPVPMVHPNTFMPLNSLSSFYSANNNNNNPASSPGANRTPENANRSESLSPPSKLAPPQRSQTPVQQHKPARTVPSDDDESDIEV